jgi:ribulose bisphosphate carboxylase small subunit
MSYYLSPRFQNQLAVHITKNYLDLPQVRVPLILGIHGRKGEGKTFQCELVYERMGLEVVHISGGELESPDAGDPARLIRLRYREAAELVRVRGKMAIVMINDLDAGAGRFDGMTQYTVNTQLVNNTLMNIADNPTNVQLPGSYDDTPLPRIPIIVTGNDFATLYAPLIRDGRMTKFYWEPDRDDRIGIISGIFALDGLSRSDIEALVDTFPTQAIDFYSALRAQIYDEQIIDFIQTVGIENVSRNVVNTTKPPSFKRPDFRLNHLIEVGNRLVREQRRIQEVSLVREYNQALHLPMDKAYDQPDFYRSYSGLVSENRADGQLGLQNSGHIQPSQVASDMPMNANGQASALKPATRQQVLSLLQQGYRVGVEHVDERRFRTNSWQSCATIDTRTDQTALSAMEQCLAQYKDEYVRLIGINPKSKQRVLEQIIHRPVK